MKLWALTNPDLPGDFIMLDEAQDTNPVLEEIFLAQRAQRQGNRVWIATFIARVVRLAGDGSGNPSHQQ